MKNAKRGILVHGCFMVGNRGETAETLRKHYALPRISILTLLSFFPLWLILGQVISKYFKEKGWIVTDNFRKWLTDDGLHSSVVSNPELSYETLVAFVTGPDGNFTSARGTSCQK